MVNRPQSAHVKRISTHSSAPELPTLPLSAGSAIRAAAAHSHGARPRATTAPSLRLHRKCLDSSATDAPHHRKKRPVSALARSTSEAWGALDADRCIREKASLAAARRAMQSHDRPSTAPSSMGHRWRPARLRCSSDFTRLCQPSGLLQSAVKAGIHAPVMVPRYRRSKGVSLRQIASASVADLAEQNQGQKLSKEDSLLLGVSANFLTARGETGFVAEIEQKCGLQSADFDYYAINHAMFSSPQSRGAGHICPRDGLRDCSYVDALEVVDSGRATVFLSWTYSYSVHTVVSSLEHWCMRCGCDAASTFIWQSSLCCNQFRIEQASNIGQDTKDESRSFEDIEMLQWRMRKIGSVLALLSPWNGPQYLQRSWCLLEFWEATRTDEVQLHVVLPDQQQSSMLAAVEAGSLQTLWAALESVSLESASAKFEGDRDRINAYIARECGCESSTPQTIARVKHAIIRRLRIWLCEELTRHLELQALTGELVSPIFCAEVTRILEESSETEQAQSLINAVVRSLELWSMQSAESAESYCKGTLLKTKGILHYVQNQYAHSLTCFEKAKDAYEMSEQTSTDDYASVLKYLGLCCTRHSRHEDALGFFALSKSAHEAAETIETPGYATMLKNTGDCHDKMGNSEESMKFYLEAERIFESSGKTLEYARLLKRLGEMLQDSCHYSLASDRFLLAKDVYESIGVSSNSGYASVLKYLAVWLREQDEFDVAMELLVAATWVHEDIGQTKTLPYAALQKSIGVCHRDAGEYDQATAAFERAKLLYDELSGGRVPGERAALFKSMAACMREQGKVKEAMAMYEEAKSTLELDGETMTRGYAWILNLKGSLLSEQAQYDQAISLFEAAESILETLLLKGRKDHSIVLKNKGVCYCEQGRHTEALAVFEEAKHAYEYAGAVTSTDYAVLLKEMSKCSFQRGHPEEALQILSAAERVCNSEELSCGWRVHCRLQRCIAECYIDQRKKREAKAILIQARDAVNELRTAGKAQDDKLLSDIVDLISKLDRNVL